MVSVDVKHHVYLLTLINRRLGVRWQSPGEMKSREVELGSHSWIDRLDAELFFNSCFSDSVFVTYRPDITVLVDLA